MRRTSSPFLAALLLCAPFIGMPEQVHAGQSTIGDQPATPKARKVTVRQTRRVVTTTTSAPSSAFVWEGAKIKAYPVGRYIDPSNGRVMHERHVIYRVEQRGGFVLSAPQSNQILVGPVLSAGPTRDRPALLRQELSGEVARLRQENALAEEQVARFRAAQDKMTKAANDLAEQAAAYGQQGNAIAGLRREVAELKARMAAQKPGPAPIAEPSPAPPGSGSPPPR